MINNSPVLLKKGAVRMDVALRRQLIRDMIRHADSEGDSFLKYLLEMALLHLEQKGQPRPLP